MIQNSQEVQEFVDVRNPRNIHSINDILFSQSKPITENISQTQHDNMYSMAVKFRAENIDGLYDDHYSRFEDRNPLVLPRDETKGFEIVDDNSNDFIVNERETEIVNSVEIDGQVYDTYMEKLPMQNTDKEIPEEQLDQRNLKLSRLQGNVDKKWHKREVEKRLPVADRNPNFQADTYNEQDMMSNNAYQSTYLNRDTLEHFPTYEWFDSVIAENFVGFQDMTDYTNYIFYPETMRGESEFDFQLANIDSGVDQTSKIAATKSSFFKDDVVDNRNYGTGLKYENDIRSSQTHKQAPKKIGKTHDRRNTMDSAFAQGVRAGKVKLSSRENIFSNEFTQDGTLAKEGFKRDFEISLIDESKTIHETPLKRGVIDSNGVHKSKPILSSEDSHEMGRVGAVEMTGADEKVFSSKEKIHNQRGRKNKVDFGNPFSNSNTRGTSGVKKQSVRTDSMINRNFGNNFGVNLGMNIKSEGRMKNTQNGNYMRHRFDILPQSMRQKF